MNNCAPTLSEGLLEIALATAQTAFSTSKSSDRSTQFTAALSTGVSVELLLKHLLARSSPLHLAPLSPSSPAAALKTRRLLSNSNIAHDSNVADVESCSAREAMVMVCEIYGEGMVDPDGFKAAMAVRNAACHLGLPPTRDRMEDGLFGMLFLVDAACKAGLVERKQLGILGGHEAAEFMRSYRASRLSFVKNKLDTCRSRRLSPSEAKPLIDEFFSAETKLFIDDDATSYHSSWGYASAKCVCKAQAKVLVEIESEIMGDEEDPNDPMRVGTIIHPYALGCMSCGLMLNSRESNLLRNDSHGWANEVFAMTIVDPLRGESKSRR